jgi:hypothetical protein
MTAGEENRIVTDILTANTLTEREERMLNELLGLRARDAQLLAACQEAANLLDLHKNWTESMPGYLVGRLRATIAAAEEGYGCIVAVCAAAIAAAEAPAAIPATPAK